MTSGGALRASSALRRDVAGLVPVHATAIEHSPMISLQYDNIFDIVHLEYARRRCPVQLLPGVIDMGLSASWANITPGGVVGPAW